MLRLRTSPGFPPGFVRRRRLVDRLTGSATAKLAVIVAPAGYGKSTLLYEWADRDPRPFVWMGFGAEGAGLSERAAVAALDAVRARHPAFVLVIDDAQALPPSLLRGAVAPFVAELPEGSLVAVASRAEPALALGRLRAHRSLVELGMRDLAMTATEAALLLRRAGLKLDPDAVDALVARTEGWPAALYLAAISADGENSKDVRFGGDDYLLGEFLRDEVLSAVPADLTDFMLRAAVLDELSGPLCDDVLEVSGSARALARLERASRLLIPLDPAHERYRWHRLFADALRAELRRSDPDLETRLGRRASAWYARRGDTDRAIGHAVAAGDAKRAGHLLWANIPSYTGHGRAMLVQRWLDCFSHDRIAGSAPLALSAAYNSLAIGRVDHAQHWVAVAAAGLERDTRVRRPSSLDAGLAIVEALVGRGGALQLREELARADQLELGDGAWRPVLCLMRGVVEHLLGEPDAARALLQRGADLSTVTAPGIASLCLAVDVMVAIEQEDWESAAELADRAADLIRDERLSTYPVSALVYAACAAVRAHQGRVDEAKHDLRRGTELLAELGDYLPWYGADARILLAHASLWLADVVGARTLLAEASRLARKVPDAAVYADWFNRAWEYMDTLAESSLSGPSSLTIAELRILRFLPTHRSFREIAEQLGVSSNTVKTQAHAVYRKLGAASRSEAVARGAAAGLLGQ